MHPHRPYSGVAEASFDIIDCHKANSIPSKK
jgi:hypothetical protein